MDTEEYHDDSMAESEDVEEEEEEERYGYGYYDYDEHECKECKKCTTDASYGYVSYIRPVIFTAVPKLMNIASVAVAVSLWHHVNVTYAISRVSRKCTKNSEKWKTLCNEVLKLPKELPVPKSIREIIVKYLNVMAARIPLWVSYHFRVVFLKEGQDKALYKLINLIIWYPNGAINCKQTAINMLSSLRLSDVEKFKFLATYCLEEEMRRLSPSLFASTMLEYVNFSEYPLIYYWYCYFRNELEKIPVTGNLSIDCFMFRYRNVDNWSAKEYFFDRMNSDEQVQQAMHMIDQHKKLYLRSVLFKLNETQRLLVCMERPIRIAKYYAENKVNHREFLSIWFDICHLITQDQFLNIFREFLVESAPNIVLMEIFTSAPENFKLHLLNHNDHEFVEKMFGSLKLIKSELIFTMLQDANDSTRKSIAIKDFFVNFCKKLLARNEFSKFSRLINLCYPNIQDSAQFTRNVVASSICIKGTCLKHYSSGTLKDINDLMTSLFSSNSDIILNYKKDLLMSPEGIEMCVNTLDSKTDILNAIIADASFSADLTSTFIKEIIFSSSALCKFKDWIMNGQSIDVRNCIDRYLTSNDDKTSFKKTLMTSECIKDKFLKDYSTGNLKDINDLLTLMFSSDSEIILNYKKDLLMSPEGIEMCVNTLDSKTDILNAIIADGSFPADSASMLMRVIIFSSSATRKFKDWIMDGQLKEVQNCINRYLTSNEDKTSLKKILITSPNRVMRNILKQHDESYWQTLILWYYEDEKLVQEFKQKLNMEQMFFELLKASVFEVYALLLKDCKFKSHISFDRLDRFLNWYFQSPNEVMKYKMRKIDKFQNIEMIKVLLKKKDNTQLKAVMKWFFQNDAAEINKFKLKHNCNSRKLCDLI